MTQSPSSNFDGAIAAANSLLTSQGYGIRDYPSNMGGLVSAILALNLSPVNIGITPPQWMPTRDENGLVTGDGWDPAPKNGTLWFDTRQGRLMVWVNDGFYQANGNDQLVALSDEAPSSPIKGQTWYSTSNGVYYIYSGSTWVAITGGENSFATLSSDILQIQNQVDELSVRRSGGREYEVFNVSATPAAPNGKISINSLSVNDIYLIAIADEDKNSILSQPGALNDLIDIESSNGEIVRFSITNIDNGVYTVSKLLGTRDLILDETVKVFVYPQNADYATITYTNDQINTLQSQLDAMEVSVTADQMQALETEINDLTITINSLPTGATPQQLDELQTQITSNDADITTITGNIASIDTRVSTIESGLSDYALAVDLSSLTTNVQSNLTAITALQSDATALQSQIDEINNTKIANLQNEIDALETELGNRNKIHYSDAVPTVPLSNGDLWFDSTNLRILVYHQNMWINPDRSAGGVLVDEKQIYYQNTEPVGTHLNEGDLWFNNTTLRLHVYHQNAWTISDQIINTTRALIVDAAQQTNDFASFRQYIIDNA